MSESVQKKVLIAEDEQDLREALTSAMEAEGYMVSVAVDGDEALTKALAERPDVVLLDINMPGKNGQEVLDGFHADEWGKRANIIVLTAYSDPHTTSTTKKLGAAEYLVKNEWTLEDIVRKVSEKMAA